MQRSALVIVLLLILVSAAYFLIQSRTSQSEIPTPTPTPNNLTSSCKVSDLQASVQTEGAAGSIYGSMSIKNISSKTCIIVGTHFIQPIYQAKNITAQHQGSTGPMKLLLAANQTAYSQIRYQNGPQCSSTSKQEMVTFRYPLSEKDYLVFKTPSGNSELPVVVCSSPTESTLISVWSLSSQPINQ